MPMKGALAVESSLPTRAPQPFRPWVTTVLARKLTWPLTVLAVLMLLMINEASHRQAMQALDRLGQRAQATLRLQSALRHWLEAESGHRGYLLTGRQDYLQPYRDAVIDADAALVGLERFYADDPASLQLVAEMRRLAGQRMQALSKVVHAYDAGQHELVRSLLAEGIAADMDAVRTLADRLARLQRQRVVAERQSVMDILQFSRIGINAAGALGVLTLLLVLRLTRAMEGEQLRHAQALQEEQLRLEAEVQRRTADLTALARHLQSVREDERGRLARQLHDELGALLTATKHDLFTLRRELAGAGPEVLTRLQHLSDIIDRGMALKRRIIEGLRPTSLARLGLAAALEELLKEFGERAGVEVRHKLADVALSEAAEITVYRLVQEGLTNIAKYAGADQVHVELVDEGGTARVAVRDDGCGFDTATAVRCSHGLMGMRYRVEAAGGRFMLHSAPGQGTVLEALLPQSPAPAAANATPCLRNA